MRDVMRKAAAEGVRNTEIHTFEQIAAAFGRFGSDGEKKWFADVGGHIDGDFASDDHFSVAAKKGSILLFDTKGIHRGGVVRRDERLLVRDHCFEPKRGADARPWARRMMGRLRSALATNVFGWG